MDLNGGDLQAVSLTTETVPPNSRDNADEGTIEVAGGTASIRSCLREFRSNPLSAGMQSTPCVLCGCRRPSQRSFMLSSLGLSPVQRRDAHASQTVAAAPPARLAEHGSVVSSSPRLLGRSCMSCPQLQHNGALPKTEVRACSTRSAVRCMQRRRRGRSESCSSSVNGTHEPLIESDRDNPMNNNGQAQAAGRLSE